MIPTLLGLAMHVMTITGYHTDPWWTTADRTQVQYGIAACPANLPFGTVLEIEGLGGFACHDRIPGNPPLIDLWMPDREACLAVTGRYEVEW